jgi:hypothetical protein
MEKKIKDKVMEEVKKRGLITEQKKDSNKFDEMVSKILHSRTQAHVFHLQTKSYAEHIALNGYYDGIIPLMDGIIESYQGKYGIVGKYISYDIENYDNNSQVIKYFQGLEKDVDGLRDSVKDSYLQNQIDTIVELLNSTIYKLKFLK